MLIAKQLETFKKVYSIIKLCGIQRRNFMLREIANDFYMNQNYNCGECILRAANKAYNLDLDERALKLASGSGLDFVIFVPSEIASKSSVSCVCARMNFVFLLEEPIAR